MSPKPRFLLLCGLLLPASPVPAEQLLTLDPATSRIGFTLGATLHSVEGTIRVERGEIRFLAEGGPASGEIVVDATSANTENEGRDKDMHKKVLESETFGSFVLRPTETVGTLSSSGTSSIEVHGELEIHGGTFPVVLPAEVTIDGETITGTATLNVPYVDWGMKDPSKLFLRVEKFVGVEVHLSGRISSVTESPETSEVSEVSNG